MRAQDKQWFAQAAQQFRVWILVRRSNRSSLNYIGQSGYVPKPIDCKAKTADSDIAGKPYRLAGLVVDPTRLEAAFSPARLPKANQEWAEFAGKHALHQHSPGSRYSLDLDPGSRHYGCLMLHGKYVHADYDLYDIIPLQHPRGNLAAVETLLGQPHMRGPVFHRVRNFVNGRIGVDMIQHGGEAQYCDHSEQSIDLFGPQGQECTILNEFSVRAWYQTVFEGRRTLQAPHR